MSVWVLLLTAALLAFAQRAVIRRFALKGLSYTRRFSRQTAFPGEKAELVEVIRNDRPLFIPWLRVESRISPHLRFGRAENLQVSGERYHRSVFTLRPYQQITRRHSVLLTHRGAYDVGHVSLTAGELLGGGDTDTQRYTPARIIVYPRLLSERELPIPVSRLQGDLIVRRHVTTDPFFNNGIRPYQRGDQRRDIHWPATARMAGQLQVKTHDYTADTKLMVLINCQMSENQWGNLMDYEQAVIEYAVSLAATVCLRVLSAGVAAGFAANMPVEDDQKGCAQFPPAFYAGREEELLSAFAHLRILRTRSFLSFLEDFYFLRDTDILLISPYTSPAMEERLAQLRRLGNTVTVYQLPKEVA